MLTYLSRSGEFILAVKLYMRHVQLTQGESQTEWLRATQQQQTEWRRQTPPAASHLRSTSFPPLFLF
jgi:hypothetical protein